MDTITHFSLLFFFVFLFLFLVIAPQDAVSNFFFSHYNCSYIEIDTLYSLISFF